MAEEFKDLLDPNLEERYNKDCVSSVVSYNGFRVYPHRVSHYTSDLCATQIYPYTGPTVECHSSPETEWKEDTKKFKKLGFFDKIKIVLSILWYKMLWYLF